MNKPIICVFATDEKMGFAKDGKIPWYLGDDRVFFKDLTTRTYDPDKQNAVIMGRRTWEDLPEKFRPLKGRVNVVLTKDYMYNSDRFEGADYRFSCLNEAVEALSADSRIESIFMIGGEKLLREAFLLPNCRLVVQSIIPGEYDCDQFLRAPADFKLTEMSPVGPMTVFWLVKDVDGN